VAGAAFGKVYVRMADAFEARAKALSPGTLARNTRPVNRFSER
jgi:hypothetical protein